MEAANNLRPIRFIDPLTELAGKLLSVEKPARYSGGEFGRLASKNADLYMLIAFPDLYEIGMCNQALRILYNGLNKLPGISCDRAFAPAPDFEQLLRSMNLPMYGLDTGISLKDTDILLFTLGYELGAGGILNMLDVSDIPIHSCNRGDNDPLVIAGGPVVSNPLPYSNFIDAFWIGEAETGFFELAIELKELKQKGQGRAALFEKIAAHPNMWVKEKNTATRAVYNGFVNGEASVYPLPSMKIIQHHGALEIMRGCPNGCRFCHAGIWYRPMRQKPAEKVIEEANAFVKLGGYREISLSSLSSGDYSGIAEMVESLNRHFEGRRISFQMPSLKVSGFSLSILEQISHTRKSGLTFAVETPIDAWQMSINKEVTRDSVVEIIKEARKHGWRGAKFYFMIGLPLEKNENEETEIVNFIIEVARKTQIHFNINVGIFVPKPHTPFQWAAQIDAETAFAKLELIRKKLKPLGHKVSVSDPLVSIIEGFISRGDERAGFLIEEAFRKGSRLDAWSEYINTEVWKEILINHNSLINEFLAEKSTEEKLPWYGVHSGVSPAYLKKEWLNSQNHTLTSPCNDNCTSPCGICRPEQKIIKNILPTDNNDSTKEDAVNLNGNGGNNEKKTDPAIWRILFEYSKHGPAVFQSHLSIIEIFSMALVRSGLPVLYSQGFNPLIKLEIASPLALGISSHAEIACLDFSKEITPDLFKNLLNANLPEGMTIGQAECFYIPSGSKKHSLASLLWGSCYLINNSDVNVEYSQEKQFRTSCGIPAYNICRKSLLAKNIINDGNNPWASYFDIYQHLHNSRQNVRYE